MRFRLFLMTKVESGRAPNDQRSNVKNPTSSEYKAVEDRFDNIHNPTSEETLAALNNKANQMNPNHTVDRGSRKKKRVEGKKKWPDLTDWALKRLWKRQRF